MTQEEWYASPGFIKLRFLNTIASGIQYKTQELYDVLELIAAEQEVMVSDRFSLVERQLRIVNLEAAKLWDYCRKLETTLQPRIEDAKQS